MSSFVGRTADIRQLKPLVRAKRLVTLVGVGGVGKTRLATRVAIDVASSFPAGRWFIDLASVDEAGLVAQTVASAVGVVDAPSTSVVRALTERFRAGRCLILLDNCEHLVHPAAELATELLDECPFLTVLATSREPLSCDGEHVYQVRPLALPSRDGHRSLMQVARSEAAQLFLERAAAAADFRPDESLSIAVRFGDWRLTARQLLLLACIAFEKHRGIQAARLLGAGEALYQRLEVANEFPIPELEPLREAARDGALASAREKGRAMPVNHVVAAILNRGVDRDSTSARNRGPLTTRETEVARCVANGWSNRAIAEHLVVAERTVENHVSHILDKLGLSSRTQLASRLLSVDNPGWDGAAAGPGRRSALL